MTQAVPGSLSVSDGHAFRVEDVPDPEVGERASRRTYTAKYKLEVLAEYERLDKAGKGALLRREGLYTSLISAWREQRDNGCPGGLVGNDAVVRSRSTRRRGRTSGWRRRTPGWRLSSTGPGR